MLYAATRPAAYPTAAAFTCASSMATMRVSACARREHHRRGARRSLGAATTRRCLRIRESWRQVRAQHRAALCFAHTVAEACASRDAESSAAPSARCMRRDQDSQQRRTESTVVEKARGTSQRSHRCVVIAARKSENAPQLSSPMCENKRGSQRGHSIIASWPRSARVGFAPCKFSPRKIRPCRYISA